MSYAVDFKLNWLQSYKKNSILVCNLQFLYKYFLNFAQITRIVHQKKPKKK